MRTLTSIGFGCGRLKSGPEHRAYVALVESAVQSGVRYFDCAPSYGLGYAENILGEVLAGARSGDVGDPIFIATKVGIARPAMGGIASQLRGLIRPIFKALPMARKLVQAGMSGTSKRGQFGRDQILRSVEGSCKRLRSQHLNALLLHEPTPQDVTPELVAVFDELVRNGAIGSQGSSTNDAESALVEFGEISQFRWTPKQSRPARPSGHIVNVHGVVADWRARFQQYLAADPQTAEAISRDHDVDLQSAEAVSALLIYAVATQFRCRVIFSTNDKARLAATLSILGALEFRGMPCSPALAEAIDCGFAPRSGVP